MVSALTEKGERMMNKDTIIAALLAGVISALLNILIICAGGASC
jgi:hypothetical protein